MNCEYQRQLETNFELRVKHLQTMCTCTCEHTCIDALIHAWGEHSAYHIFGLISLHNNVKELGTYEEDKYRKAVVLYFQNREQKLRAQHSQKAL